MPALQKTPKVLILSFQNFSGIAHLPKSLNNAGFKVAAICPPTNYLATTRFLEKVYSLPKYFLYWNIRERFMEVVEEYEPRLLIPGDDIALAFLQNLYFQLPQSEYPDISRLLKRSLGDPSYYGACTDKGAFGQFCENLGLNIPSQYPAKSTNEVMQRGSRLGYPVVFKKTLSCGGAGVEICETEEELKRHATNFFGTGPMPFSEKMRWEVHMARGLDNRHLMSPQEDSIVVQEFISGSVLSHTFASSEGQYLSGFTYQNLNSAENSKLPCRQLQILDVQYDCEEIARLLSDTLKLNGFACIDYIRNDSGRLFVLECNARPTHTVVLGERIGIDLAKLFFQRSELDTSNVEEGHFSLFPDAMRENPAGFDPKRAVIPWDDPELMTSFFNDPRPRALSKKWLAKMPFPWIKNRWKGYRNAKLVIGNPTKVEVKKKESLLA